jgi:hypothetical protein
MVLYRIKLTSDKLDDLILQWESEPDQVTMWQPAITLQDLRDAREHLRARRGVVEQSLIFNALEGDEPERLKASDPDYYRQAERSSATVDEWEQKKKAIEQRIAQLETEAEQSEEFQAAIKEALPTREQLEQEIPQRDWERLVEEAKTGTQSADEFLDRFSSSFSAALDQFADEQAGKYRDRIDLEKHRYVWLRLDRTEKNQVVRFLPEYLGQSMELAEDVYLALVEEPSVKPPPAPLDDATRERRRRAAEDAELREMQRRAYEDAIRSLD